MRLKTTGKVALALLIILLAYAWIDGGSEPQRLIVQPVELPENLR